MLTENNDIDQLFRRKLGEYEKTPPASAWTNIEVRLQKRERGFHVLQRSVAAAAVIVVALAAGLWIQNTTTQKNTFQNTITQQAEIKNNGSLVNVNSEDSKGKVQSPSNSEENQSKGSKIASLAAFAPNAAILNIHEPLTTKMDKEKVLPDSGIKLLDKLEQNLNTVKEIAAWITEKVSNDSLPSTTTVRKTATTVPKTFFESGRSKVTTVDYPKSKSTGWSLQAEFAPVYTSQGAITGQIGSSNTSITTSRQNTTAENTFSAGIVAGYKLNKRLTVKSGIVYNTIRQSTRNIDFIGVAPFFNQPGKAILANTPAGKVTLHNTDRNIVVSELNSNNQSDDGRIYSDQTVLKQTINFVEIPLRATYKLIRSKLNIGLTGGLSAGMLLQNKAILSGNGNYIGTGETSNLRNMVYSGTAGLEFGYVITNRITFTVEPRLKHYLSSLNANNSVNFKPNQLEISTGLTYSFN